MKSGDRQSAAKACVLPLPPSHGVAEAEVALVRILARQAAAEHAAALRRDRGSG